MSPAHSLRQPLAGPILLLLADGWGGIPLEPGGQDELALARTPNLDSMARGCHIPLSPGLTPTPRAAYHALLGERYGLSALLIAGEPWHVSIAHELGIATQGPQSSLGMQVDTLEKALGYYDLLILPYGHIDRAARARHSPGKVELIERLDAVIPTLRTMAPRVLVVTGGWSTPSVIGRPTWHPVPLFLDAPWATPAELTNLNARQILPLAIAHADGWRECDAP